MGNENPRWVRMWEGLENVGRALRYKEGEGEIIHWGFSSPAFSYNVRPTAKAGRMQKQLIDTRRRGFSPAQLFGAL